MAADGKSEGAPSEGLAALLDGYVGPVRVRRALYVAGRLHEQHPQRAAAYGRALAEIRAQTLNVERYEQTARYAEENLGAGASAGALDPEGADWKKAAHRRGAEQEAALEEELQAVMRTSVKGKIRDVIMRLARHLALRGEWSAAMARFLEAKEYSESEENTLDASLGAVRVALFSGAMGHVKSQVARALQLRGVFAEGRRPEARSQLLAFQALYELSRHSYGEAAATLLRVDPRHLEHGRGFEDVAKQGDVATWLALCGLATLDRQALKLQLMGTDTFRRFAEGQPRLASMVECFHSCRFGDAFRELAAVRQAQFLDLFAGPFVDRASAMIRESALIQYFRPFVSVRIPSMAAAFGLDADDLERELIALIGDKKIHARIDAAHHVLYSKNTDARLNTFRQATDAGGEYLARARAALLRMSLVEEDIVVPGGRDADLDDYADFDGPSPMMYRGGGGGGVYDMGMGGGMDMDMGSLLQGGGGGRRRRARRGF